VDERERDLWERERGGEEIMRERYRIHRETYRERE
jgi:hypothetical protein